MASHEAEHASANAPYSIQLLFSTEQSSSFVIREKDNYGEYPNIFAKVYYTDEGRKPIVVILSDTGTGLNAPGGSTTRPSSQNPVRWNIATFLSTTVNQNHAAPYIVLTTHCHYDHIMGIHQLLEANAQVTMFSSSHDKNYLTPWRNLQKHSLCELIGLKAPVYDARWIDDVQRLPFTDSDGTKKQSSVTVIHTPGHTPDSISWYDRDSSTLCVGDMFYEKESDETRSGSQGRWSREPVQPVIFTHDSNIVDWNASMHRLLDFVRYENRRMGTEERSDAGYRQTGQGVPLTFIETSKEDWSFISATPARRRVVLCAAHVTIATDAEFALLNMLAFMLRIQLDQVPKKRTTDIEGGDDAWLWDDCLDQHSKGSSSCQYSVKAPWSIVHRRDTLINVEPQVTISRVRSKDSRTLMQMTTTSSGQAQLTSAALASVSHSSALANRPPPNVYADPGMKTGRNT